MILRKILTNSLLGILLVSWNASLFAYEQELERITKKLSQAIDATGKQNVAAVDFANLQGQITELGRFLAEEISTGLVLSSDRKFSIVDRTNLQRVLSEQKLSMSGLLNPENSKRIGKIAGVDALIIGNITSLSEEVRLSIKVIETETAKVLAAARGNIALTGAVKIMLEREIEQVATAPQGMSGRVQTKTSVQNKGKAERSVYENDLVRLEMRSISTSTNSDKINLSLRLTNISEGVVWLAFNSQNRPFLVDERAQKWRYYDSDGVTRQSMAKRGIPVAAGQSVPVWTVFSPEGGLNGQVFSFTAFFLAYTEKERTQTDFVAVLEDLKLSK